MIKRIFGTAFLWLAGCLGLTFWTIHTSSLTGIAVTVLWLVIPFLTFLLNRTVRNRIHVSIKVPATMGKNKKTTAELILKNNSVISVSKILCKLKITNHLTSQTSTMITSLSAAAGEEASIDFEITSAHCGYLIVEIEKIFLMDWFGFLPVSCKANASGKISVLPDTFVPGISLSLSATAREDAQNWSQTHKGNDMTEVFALRDYVPGDSLKQIHWKLSSKKQQLIVREPSLSVEKSLLIYWDKNTRAVNGKEIDAMAECMSSICQEILNQGITYTIGWTEGKLCVFENIDTDDQLLSVIPRMLKHGAEPDAGSGSFLNVQSGNYGSYGKVIYLAGTYPEDFRQFSDGELSLVLCGKQNVETEFSAVFFDASNYEEDFEMIEL